MWLLHFRDCPKSRQLRSFYFRFLQIHAWHLCQRYLLRASTRLPASLIFSSVTIMHNYLTAKIQYYLRFWIYDLLSLLVMLNCFLWRTELVEGQHLKKQKYLQQIERMALNLKVVFAILILQLSNVNILLKIKNFRQRNEIKNCHIAKQDCLTKKNIAL